MSRPNVWEWERLIDKSGMSKKARHVALVLGHYMNPDGTRGFPGSYRLADDTGYARGAVEKGLRELEERGYVSVKQRGGSSRERGRLATEYVTAWGKPVHPENGFTEPDPSTQRTGSAPDPSTQRTGSVPDPSTQSARPVHPARTTLPKVGGAGTEPGPSPSPGRLVPAVDGSARLPVSPQDEKARQLQSDVRRRLDAWPAERAAADQVADILAARGMGAADVPDVLAAAGLVGVEHPTRRLLAYLTDDATALGLPVGELP